MDSSAILPNIPDESLSKELLYARFKTYAKEHFQTYMLRDDDYLQYIKNSALLLNLRLPEEKNELFISSAMAQYFWLCDSAFLVRYEEWLKIEARGKAAVLDGYRSMKEYYSKWAVLKNEQEKKYYALSLFRGIDTDLNRNNFLKYLLQASIYIYDRKMADPAKAIEILNNTGELVESTRADNALKDEVYYLIFLFCGFAYLKLGSYSDASMSFAEAIRIKASGITAKFYLAFSDKKGGHPDSAEMLLSELIEYDKSMLEYGIESNKIGVMSYILFNAVTYHIFRENEFADMLDAIDGNLRHWAETDGFTFEQTGSLIYKLEDLHLKEFYSEEVVSHLEFLDKAYRTFMGNNNILIRFSKPFLQSKFMKITGLIVSIISQKYMKEIGDELTMFDLGIDENREAIKYLTKESDEVKVTYKKKLEDALKDLDNRAGEAVAAVERKIESIQTEKEYDPQTAFNNTMVYNFIVTFIVFIIGGFSGCYGDRVNNMYDYKDVMSGVILYGGKWAAITFLVGIVVSAFSAVSAFTERINEKQNLLKKISALKSQKERESELIRRDIEKKEQSVLENYKERIEEHQKSADNLQQEKDARYIALKEISDKKIKVHTDKIDTLFQ